MTWFEGPVPPPAVIAQYNSIVPDSGTRMLDDAHADVVASRQVSIHEFSHSVREANLRLVIATGITVLSFFGVFLCLFGLEPPESIVGASLCGLGTLAPTVRTFLRPSMNSV